MVFQAWFRPRPQRLLTRTAFAQLMRISRGLFHWAPGIPALSLLEAPNFVACDPHERFPSCYSVRCPSGSGGGARTRPARAFALQ